jgi:hypothetical protein
MGLISNSRRFWCFFFERLQLTFFFCSNFKKKKTLSKFARKESVYLSRLCLISDNMLHGWLIQKKNSKNFIGENLKKMMKVVTGT